MKILLVSHLPMSTQHNMGKTFLSLMAGLERQELCQLYIYPAFPDGDWAASFYRVTDKQIIKSLPFGKKVGGCVEPVRITGQSFYENPEDESFYRDRKNKSPLRRLLRDGIWRWGNWNNASLHKWLREQKPDCIFLAPGPAKFIYNIALKLAKEYEIPIVTYICDEYYFVDTPKGLLSRVQLRRLQKKIEQTIAASSHLVVICDELKAAYSKFGKPITTVMTGASFPVAEASRGAEKPAHICYFGNIRCNRYLSLARVGKALDALNGKLGTDYKLKIYTSEKDPEILSVFDGITSVQLPGFVTGEAYQREFENAQLLLHVEAFDAGSIHRVRHSVSTKIADSLASGKPLLAYGPAQVASMGHLLRHRCAITATDEDGLEGMLLTAFTDWAASAAAAEKGLEVARTYHDSDLVGRQMREVFEDIL